MRTGTTTSRPIGVELNPMGENIMKIAVWTVSSLLACAFLVAGAGKLLTPPADLQQMAQGVPVALLKVAGAAEVLGALGLVLPAATRIAPVLTPVAAVGLVVTMIGATITNVVIGDLPSAAATVLLGSLAAFVAWARFGAFSVEARGTSRRGGLLTSPPARW